MPLQATSGAASYDAFGGGVAAVPNYIEDVFSTYLYTGNGSTQTITNGIDLAGKGGLTWVKSRQASSTGHVLVDTARGAGYVLESELTSAQYNTGYGVTAFSSSGFSVTDNSSGGGYVNGAPGGTYAGANALYASWTFRKQPKFFDVVTYTGDGTTNRSISHNLGSTPGCLIVKRVTGSALDWHVYHRSLNTPLNKILVLNSTSAEIDVGSPFWGVSSTDFSLPASGGGGLNTSGATYVAYLYAHDSGGFGLTGTDNVISCGSFTTDGSGNATVDLGYEPQWIMYKTSNTTSQWVLRDTMRGWPAAPSSSRNLFANLSSEEQAGGGLSPNATGFQAAGIGAGNTFIYIAIRRGPMKVPTDGTKVFEPISAIGSGGTVRTTGFPVDLQIMLQKDRANYINTWAADRLRGVSTTDTASGRYVFTNTTGAEATANAITRNFGNTGYVDPGLFGSLSMLWWNFARAPSVMDVVCWTGDGTGNPRNHNLTVYPELVISKLRSGGAGFGAWNVQNNINPSAKQTGVLNTTAAFSSSGATSPTATVFYPTDDQSGATYVTYLFSSCPGVSKVGSYTGTGATQTINCGFTGGARFVLIKRTDSSDGGNANWWVWDTARGMTAGTDYRIPLNTTDADSNFNSVYTASSGFQIVTADGSINANGGTYIFLAIA